MRFCCNLSFMFTEVPFLERYNLAKLAGFKAVESGFPFGIALDDVVKAKEEACLEQVLLNIYTGDITKGEFGHAAVPGKEQEFKDALEKTIDYAKALNCKKIHIMAGKVAKKTKSNYETYEANLRYAESKFQAEGIIGLIEPINKYSVPEYFMSSYYKALDVVQHIDSPHIKLMMDVFHLQQIQGNITRSLKELMPYTGHVQVAQVPSRNEPNISGEIDYRYVFRTLEILGYTDWIGLEYKPEVSAVKGLIWLKEFGYSL